MKWSEAPRRKKIAILSLSVVALAVGLTLIGYTVNGPSQPSADSDSTVPALDSGFAGNTQDVDVTVLDKDGKPTMAFVDMLYDADGNCSIDETETGGFTSETAETGKVTMTVDSDRFYVLRAISTVDASEGVAALSVGNVTAQSCMQALTGTENDVTVTLKAK